MSEKSGSLATHTPISWWFTMQHIYRAAPALLLRKLFLKPQHTQHQEPHKIPCLPDTLDIACHHHHPVQTEGHTKQNMAALEYEDIVLLPLW